LLFWYAETFTLKPCRGFSRRARVNPSGKKSQPSAAEQKNWASEKLEEYQAKERSLNVQELREEFHAARLPETRLDELLSASREIMRQYEVALATLAAVIDKESEGLGPASSEAIPVPKSDAEVARQARHVAHASADDCGPGAA
jgi:hypothetical protein